VPPQRVVSLVPSITELIVWLGRGEALVGRTRFCTQPAEFVGRIAVVGGTKNPRIERVIQLRPDLVIANKEENREVDVSALRSAGLDVLVTDPNSVPEAVTMTRELGATLGAADRAQGLAHEVAKAIDRVPSGSAVPIYVGVWHNPMMGLGSQSYGHSLIEMCGGRNVLGNRPRYPEVTFDQLRGMAPDLILLPDEPFPFDESHVGYYGAVAPARPIDGKLMWWYGPRMPQAIRALSAVFDEVRVR